MPENSLIDIIVTTYNRKDFLKATIEAVAKFTRLPYRLFVADDCSDDGTAAYLMDLKLDHLCAVIIGKKRQGVVYCFNQLWNLADFHDAFIEEYPYLCYLQDDATPTKEGWLSNLIASYEEAKEKCPIGFFSGYDAPEHPPESRMQCDGNEALIKLSQPATNLIAEKSFWRSIGKIPRRNPNDSERGLPSPGKGSSIDIYLTGCQSGSRFVPWAAAENCSHSQGKKILVIPGLVEHMARWQGSTWRGA